MAYHLSIVDRARHDADRIVAWLFKRSPSGALRWVIAYETAQAKVTEEPLAFGRAPEDGRFDTELRQIFFKTPRGKLYRAIFTVVGDEVRILRVRGPHQRLLRRKDIPSD